MKNTEKKQTGAHARNTAGSPAQPKQAASKPPVRKVPAADKPARQIPVGLQTGQGDRHAEVQGRRHHSRPS